MLSSLDNGYWLEWLLSRRGLGCWFYILGIGCGRFGIEMAWIAIRHTGKGGQIGSRTEEIYCAGTLEQQTENNISEHHVSRRARHDDIERLLVTWHIKNLVIVISKTIAQMLDILDQLCRYSGPGQVRSSIQSSIQSLNHTMHDATQYLSHGMHLIHVYRMKPKSNKLSRISSEVYKTTLALVSE